MLSTLPRHTPPLERMLADLGHPRSRDLARALGVSVRTVRRWTKRGDAPRVAMLALYFATRWGREAVHCEAHNIAQMKSAIAKNLQSRLDDALDQLDHLGRIGNFGAANDPAEPANRGAALARIVYGETVDLPAAGGIAEAAPVQPQQTTQFSQENQAVQPAQTRTYE